MRVAELLEVFDVNDSWACTCGRVHNFGVYVAAHWNEALEHRCECGTGRVFKSGEVVGISAGVSANDTQY